MSGDKTKFDLYGDIITLVHRYVDHLSPSHPLLAKEAKQREKADNRD